MSPRAILATSLVAASLVAACSGAPKVEPKAAAELPPTAQSLIDRVVDTYGGTEAVARFEAFRVSGVVQAQMTQKQGEFVRDFVAPNNYRVTIRYPNRQEIRILAGPHAWRGNEGGQPAVAGPPRLAMLAQLLRATVPWALIHYRDSVSLLGKEPLDGAQTYVLELAGPEEITVRFWIEAEGSRVVKAEGRFSVAGKNLKFEARYSDFKKVDGVLIAHFEQSYVNGRHTGTSRIQKVAFGQDGLGPFAPAAPQLPPGTRPPL